LPEVVELLQALLLQHGVRLPRGLEVREALPLHQVECIHRCCGGELQLEVVPIHEVEIIHTSIFYPIIA
jgi:hypothetical protein